MKIAILAVLLLLALATIVSGAPTESELLRERRGICGFAAFGLKLNHAACAARCLTKWKQGIRGGRCINGTCMCRK